MKFDKQYHVTCAVYRMLRQGRLDKAAAIFLLHKRAKVSAKLSTATVELWIRSLRNNLRFG